MKRDYKVELESRIEFIKETLKKASADGIVFGNSGGKDSALVGILCKKACDNTIGIMMPCDTTINYGKDIVDASSLANMCGIENITVDLTDTKKELVNAISKVVKIGDHAIKNIPPRLRMATVYAVAQERNSLVAGTGNRSEGYLGYFTKWGDGAHDFNPISDLTVTEIYEFLTFLGAPESIISKPPSAGLFEGQTDEKELGVTYNQVDDYLLYNKGEKEFVEKIEKIHKKTDHKRRPTKTFA